MANIEEIIEAVNEYCKFSDEEKVRTNEALKALEEEIHTLESKINWHRRFKEYTFLLNALYNHYKTKNLDLEYFADNFANSNSVAHLIEQDYYNIPSGELEKAIADIKKEIELL